MEDKSIALVGRPNVGKSRLFNRLLGRRSSIVHDKPGVTRDVVVERLGENLSLMDTGGIGASSDVAEKAIAEATTRQAEFAMFASDGIIFVVDSKEGLTPLDEEIASKLRKSGKKIALAVNKIDVPEHSRRASDFYSLGFKDVFEVSAEHGRGIGNLESYIEREFGKIDPSAEDDSEGRIKVCVAGRPNVGKSSVCNRLIGQDRLIVSDIAGTTRDSVAVDIDAEMQEPFGGLSSKFRLFDTAGLRVKRKINTSLDFFSSERTRGAIKNSDIVFLVIDAMEGVSELDKKLAGEILEEGASIILVVNKWDYAVETFRESPLSGYKNISEFKKSFESAVRDSLRFLGDSRILFVSAKENTGISGLLKAASVLYKKMNENVGTAKLNACVSKLIRQSPPPAVMGKRFKVYYAVKTSSRPYSIRLYCNTEGALAESYRKYLENGIRREFGLGGIALKIDAFGKPKLNAENRAAPKSNAKKSPLKFSKGREKKPARKRVSFGGRRK